MTSKNDSIAIIGIGCRFPGGADNPVEFWEFLKNSGNGICEVPSDRWDADAYYHPEYTLPGKISVKL